MIQFKLESEQLGRPIFVTTPRALRIIDVETGAVVALVPMYVKAPELGLDADIDEKACEVECLKRAKALVALLNAGAAVKA